MSLSVYWEGNEVGRLEQVQARSREYSFRYIEAPRAISLALPLREEAFSPAESRPFFEALLPEGAVREQIAGDLKLAASDSFGLLEKLGRDCAGALQIADAKRMSHAPAVAWLDDRELDELISELPNHPLGISVGDERLRLSLAGVQRKAVLVRGSDGRFGKPLDGMASSHILKPELAGTEYQGIAANEYFCMRLAELCGLSAAAVQLITTSGRPCLVVERFDRQLDVWPPRRCHQEDLCQALGLTPDFKYQQEGWALPSYRALAELLQQHSPSPGLDRLAGAQAAVFNYLVGNADAHAKNISLLHRADGVGLAPLYDVVCTAAYPDLSTELSLAIGDELDPEAITSIHWSDLAEDFGLRPAAFARARSALANRATRAAGELRDQAQVAGWHEPRIEKILEVIAARAERAV
jgi:serine/threonine-protein kinase HipA